jgi:hypothetical protein
MAGLSEQRSAAHRIQFHVDGLVPLLTNNPASLGIEQKAAGKGSTIPSPEEAAESATWKRPIWINPAYGRAFRYHRLSGDRILTAEQLMVKILSDPRVPLELVVHYFRRYHLLVDNPGPR